MFSTPRFSINHGGIGFARICEMGNAFERLNKSDVIELRIAGPTAGRGEGREREGGARLLPRIAEEEPREFLPYGFLSVLRNRSVGPSDDGAESSKFFIRRYRRWGRRAGVSLPLRREKITLYRSSNSGDWNGLERGGALKVFGPIKFFFCSPCRRSSTSEIFPLMWLD